MITKEEAIENYPALIQMNGYEDCVIGICHRFGQPPILAYDMDKVIRRLRADGMSYEEAVEFWEYNQLGAYVGESTPCYIERMLK